MGGKQQQGHSHRPSLKQTNKSFKSKHSSKGSLKDAAKGRVPSTSDSNARNGRKQRSGASEDAAHTRAARKNKVKQIQAQKRAAVVEKNKLTKGNEAKAPRVVAIVPLCSDVQSKDAISELLLGADLSQHLTSTGRILQVEYVQSPCRLHSSTK